MNVNSYPHPGYLYQLTRQGTDIEAILREAQGLKTKEQMLYVYLTPSSLSQANPFNNCRLKSILNEAEIVVFDSPPEKESTDAIDDFCKLLQKNYSKETLCRINSTLSESLRSHNIDLNAVNQKIGDDDPEKLALGVALKVFILIGKNLGMTAFTSDVTEATPKKMNPKQCIHTKAIELAKEIEYIDSKNFIEKKQGLLFEGGLLEWILCSLITDKELLQELTNNFKKEEEFWNLCASEKVDYHKLNTNPHVTTFQQELIGEKISEKLILARKMNDYLLFKKKTLVILEESPEEMRDLPSFISIANNCSGKVELKGPIKEPTGCFWKIKKENTTVGYLLGSIHLTPRYLLDLNSRIRKCFEKSTSLAVEIDITRQEILTVSHKETAIQWKKDLESLPIKQIDDIVTNLKKLFPAESEKVNFHNEQEKFIFISTGISKLKSEIYSKLEIFSGIDLQLIRQAKTQNKSVQDLETLEQYQQHDIVQKTVARDSINDLFLQILSLEEMVQHDKPAEIIEFVIEQISIYQSSKLKPVFDAWEEGNLEKFDHSKLHSMDEKMVMIQRNMNMAMRVVNLMNEKEKIFCCVGAAHTAGEMNVQAFLKNFGLSTERVLV